uniref:Transmembrane protein n=1 Tax=Bursaphelenchus xylophilus TaxID=6326 RepID=A0A1I7RTF3_BURXY
MVDADFWSPLPYITLVVIASLDFILFYFNTEETKGKPMPDSMPPREQSWLGRKKLDQELLDVEKKTENN